MAVLTFLILLVSTLWIATAEFDSSKTYFLKEQDRYNVASQSALNLHDSLPVGFYTVGQYPTGQYYLKEIQPFDLNGKQLYGDTTKHGKRILDTFHKRQGSTGILLAGQKGSGKTLLAKYVSTQAAKQGISTIVINEAWSGERFNAFIQSIQQPTIVLFDEFEKVYRRAAEVEMKDSEEQAQARYHNRHGHGGNTLYGEVEAPNPSQDRILTLLDGVYPSNMLFILTVNDKTKITKNMMNRPGRIYYSLDFTGLDSNFIKDYCEDNLWNVTHTSEIVSIASLFDAFSFDMLQAVVAEMNQYKESPREAMNWLNVKLDVGQSRVDIYLIRELVVNGDDITNLVQKPTWSGNPAVAEHVQFQVYHHNWMGYKDYEIHFSPKHHLVSGNITSGEFVFFDEQRGSKAVLLRSTRQNPLSMAKLLFN